MTEEHADETMVASMRADAERQGADDRKVTDAPHYLARVLMANGIRNMYGVVGIPVTDFARIAQAELRPIKDALDSSPVGRLSR